MSAVIHKRDYETASAILIACGDLERKIASAIAEERERCATIALEQRCERGNPWDDACIAIAAAIRNAK